MNNKYIHVDATLVAARHCIDASMSSDNYQGLRLKLMQKFLRSATSPTAAKCWLQKLAATDSHSMCHYGLTKFRPSTVMSVLCKIKSNIV